MNMPLESKYWKFEKELQKKKKKDDEMFFITALMSLHTHIISLIKATK